MVLSKPLSGAPRPVVLPMVCVVFETMSVIGLMAVLSWVSTC